MPGARLPIRKIRDVLRLTAAGMSSRNIALSLSVGATTVIDFLQRARSAEMSWPLPEDMTDEALEARLFPVSTALAEIKARRPQPDWRTIHRELRRKGVDAAAALGGAPCRASQRLRLQSFLRPLPRLGGAAVADYAADPCRRRTAVRRLCRHDPGGDQRSDRRSDGGSAVRRCARGIQLGRRGSPTGSARTPALSHSSAG